jgi:hypothetical protein
MLSRFRSLSWVRLLPLTNPSSVLWQASLAHLVPLSWSRSRWKADGERVDQEGHGRADPDHQYQYFYELLWGGCA